MKFLIIMISVLAISCETNNKKQSQEYHQEKIEHFVDSTTIEIIKESLVSESILSGLIVDTLKPPPSRVFVVSKLLNLNIRSDLKESIVNKFKKFRPRFVDTSNVSYLIKQVNDSHYDYFINEQINGLYLKNLEYILISFNTDISNENSLNKAVCQTSPLFFSKDKRLVFIINECRIYNQERAWLTLLVKDEEQKKYRIREMYDLKGFSRSVYIESTKDLSEWDFH